MNDVTVVGMGGMNKFKDIQIKIYVGTRNRTRDPCITSQMLYHWAIQADIHGPSSSNYHIPFPLQSLYPWSHKTNTNSLCQDLLDINASTGKTTAPQKYRYRHIHVLSPANICLRAQEFEVSSINRAKKKPKTPF